MKKTGKSAPITTRRTIYTLVPQQQRLSHEVALDVLASLNFIRGERWTSIGKYPRGGILTGYRAFELRYDPSWDDGKMMLCLSKTHQSSEGRFQAGISRIQMFCKIFAALLITSQQTIATFTRRSIGRDRECTEQHPQGTSCDQIKRGVSRNFANEGICVLTA